MDVAETLEAVKAIDRITKENPAILLLLEKMKETGNVLPVMSDGFVTLGTAAKILGSSRNYVCRMVNEQKLPCWVLPEQKVRKFRISDLHNFMNSQCKREGAS